MDLSSVRSGATQAARLARHGTVSASLAALSDEDLRELVDGAVHISSGIGGLSVSVQRAGTPVFVKQIALTDLERRPENLRSTANMFRLPTYYQYGVGSAGFGAWRELAAHVMTTGWVLEGRTESFPLMYHSRVLEGMTPRALTPEEADPARMTAYWNGSSAVRERLVAVANASARLVLFLESLPHNLHEWLALQVADGDGAIGRACGMVERNLRRDVPFMAANGLLHFDAHFHNILTDGHRLYFGDLGLATSPRFDLSDAERHFIEANVSHDTCHTVTALVNWLVTALTGRRSPRDRNAFVRRCAAGDDPTGIPAQSAAIIKRYAPIAAVMNAFYWKLHGESRTTPYPVEEIRRACAAAHVDWTGRAVTFSDGNR